MVKKFESRLQTNSNTFQTNQKDNLKLIKLMKDLEQKASDQSEKKRDRFNERNQLSPRERLSSLVDSGMPFLQLFNITGYLAEDSNPKSSIPGASIISGIGYISGVRCFIWIDDSGINAGAITMMSVEKGLACIEMAKKHKLPLVHLVESAGVNLMAYSVELWSKAGGLFGGLAQLSKLGIPVITVLHGPSTAGGAYQPGLSDYVIGIKNNGMAALAGSALVKAATGEVSDDESLGGAEMHSKVTGLVEYLAEDDIEGIKIAREVVGDLGWEKSKISVREDSEEPLFLTEEILGLIPTDFKNSYDVRELILRLVDGSSFKEFKPDYGISTFCSIGYFYGYSCGIIGNNGPIDPDGANKTTQFIQLCDQANRPIIFLNNTTGFLVGKKYEHAGMIKHGSKMIQAVMNVRVPKISFYIGASFGAGNYGMCGFAFNPDFLFTWPNSQIGVMGGQQAALTMEQVITRASKRKDKKINSGDLKKQLNQVKNHFDKQSNAFYTSGRLLDHGMIDPRDTRKVIGICLSICLDSRTRTLQPNTFGVARP